MSELGSMLFNYLSDVNKAQTQSIITDEDESNNFLLCRTIGAEPVPEPESFICQACNGSGEGMFDGSRCPVCKGHGEVPNEKLVVEDEEDYDFDN